MPQLAFTEEELLREHEYATPHVVEGMRLHGGFDADGRYISPRSLVRGPAIDAWIDALRARGGAPFEVDDALRNRPRYPNHEQQKLLIQEGLEQTLWNSLTITGLIEGRGRFLADAVFPDLQDVIVEDISEMAIGHLGKGLLKAHGLDEGGSPGIGAHDVMWFAARDLALGPRDFPMPEPPPSIGRPEENGRLAPELPEAHDRTIMFLMNLLMIEFSAESIFSSNEQLVLDPELFETRRREASEASVLIDRIRRDEEIHVTSLATYLGELRSVTLRTQDGGTLPGAQLIDRMWDEIAHFFVVEQPKLAREQQRQILTERILAHADGEQILARFNALET